ncbi:serine hydrolase domain-containing protein [Brevundimonas sp.]|uniref:serine hydrolase domain-containing protein n=1 Tax=Brevundimonas sp. TaxID=1871086 RepID=UPI00248A6B2A|nr:serine hydrolase domain-containing protein [Brevundimonas sp.]MDI1280689.1 serine hydrolase [Brevundimonas sp.]
MTLNTLSRRGTLLGGGALVLGGCAPGPAAAAAADGGPDPLQAALDPAMRDGSTSLLVMQSGRILAERYASGWSAGRPRELASVAKSIVAVLIGMAIEDGFIDGLDQSASEFIPQWRDDARRAITLRHLMSMTSGLDDTGLALRGVSGNQLAINAAAPLMAPPGTRWAYNTAAYHLLFHVLAAATGEGVEAYADRRLLGPLGMAHTRWVTNTGYGVDGPVTNYYSAASTARDLARFGTLVLNGGHHQGRPLVRAGFLQALTTPSQTLNPSYGLLWWCNAAPGRDATGTVAGYRFPRSPRDTVAALGAGGQAVLLVPAAGLVVIRQGNPPSDPGLFDDLLSSVLATLHV